MQAVAPVPRRTRPVSPRRCSAVAVMASSAAACARRAESSSACPAAVGITLPPARSSRRTDKARSSSRNCWLAAGWVKLSRRAAAETLPASTTARKVRSWRRVGVAITITYLNAAHRKDLLLFAPVRRHHCAMRYVVPFASRSPVQPQRAKLGTAARWAAARQRIRSTLFGMVLEAARYLSGCPRSRLHQRAALRDLDDRLLLDIGTTRREARARRGRDAGSP